LETSWKNRPFFNLLLLVLRFLWFWHETVRHKFGKVKSACHWRYSTPWSIAGTRSMNSFTKLPFIGTNCCRIVAYLLDRSS
jgi:hypothetical protein